MSQECTGRENLKREFPEVSSMSSSSSSSSSSSIGSRKETWTEVYTTKFLQLLEANIAKPMWYARKRVYWELFAEELNNRIKAVEPQFVGFEPMAVLKHGKELRSLYHKSKNYPYLLANFATYEKCFKDCDTCTEKPLKCDTCRITPTFSFSFDDMSQRNSSNHSSRKRRAITLGDDVAKRLAYFADMRRLSFTTITKACIHFTEFPGSARTWLKMSIETQISYLQEIFP